MSLIVTSKSTESVSFVLSLNTKMCLEMISIEFSGTSSFIFPCEPSEVGLRRLHPVVLGKIM